MRTILRHFLNAPDGKLLICCSLGKDRTGLVFALILSLAGVSDAEIRARYAWSHGLRAIARRLPTTVR